MKKQKKISFLEAYDKFILYLGKCQNENLSPAEYIPIEGDDLGDKKIIPNFKAHDNTDIVQKKQPKNLNVSKINRFRFLHYLLDETIKAKLIENLATSSNSYRLTTKGWYYYRQLLRVGGDTPAAFMAMRFDNDYEPYKSVYKDHIKSAVEETGLEIYTVNENIKSGSIDDKIRVDIRRSTF